ncbi:MAG: hypothetical protein WBJ13_02365 [Sedimentibacter sp.]
MKSKLNIVFISVFTAMMLISAGYGKWEKELHISGNIRVVPDPAVLAEMNSQLEELENQLNKHKAFAEQQRILSEQQKLLEEQTPLIENVPEQENINSVNDSNVGLEEVTNIESKDNEEESDGESGTLGREPEESSSEYEEPSKKTESEVTVE